MADRLLRPAGSGPQTFRSGKSLVGKKPRREMVIEGQRLDPRHDRLGCRLRMALVDRRQVLEAFALRLEPPLSFVEAGAIEAALAAGLCHAPQLLGAPARSAVHHLSAARHSALQPFLARPPVKPLR